MEQVFIDQNAIWRGDQYGSNNECKYEDYRYHETCTCVLISVFYLFIVVGLYGYLVENNCEHFVTMSSRRIPLIRDPAGHPPSLGG